MIKKAKAPNEKKEKPDKIATINEHCNISKLIYYVKTNIIRAPLEMAVTLYLAEALIILTDIFPVNPISVQDVIYIIFFPIVLSIVTCFIYSFVIALCVYLATCYVTKYIVVLTLGSPERQYKEINGIFRRVFFGMHFLGFSCYSVISIVVTKQLSSFWGNTVCENWPLILFGIVFGFLWNLYGCVSDCRIDWSKIFIHLEKCRITDYRKKYWAYMGSIVLQLLIIMCIVSVASFIGLRINPELEVLDIISYSSIVSLFVAVVAIYLKQTLKLFFKLKRGKEDKDSDIFPNIYDFYKRPKVNTAQK